MRDYNKLFEQGQMIHDPFRQQAEEAMRARMASQGILSSTGAQGAIQRTGDEWRSKGIDWSTQRAQERRKLLEDQRQFGVDRGLRAWELAQSAELARGQHSRDYDMRTIHDPRFFKDLFARRYSGLYGGVGDPREQKGDPDEQRRMYGPHAVGRSAPLGLKPESVYAEEHSAREAAAQRALQESLAAQEIAERRRQFDLSYGLQREQFGAEVGGEDAMWAEMADMAAANRLAAESELEDALFPTDLMAHFQTKYGIDLEAEVKAGNPRAIAIIRMMYPRDAQKIIDRIQGKTTPTFPQAHTARGGYGQTPITPERMGVAARDTGLHTFRGRDPWQLRIGKWLEDMFSMQRSRDNL